MNRSVLTTSTDPASAPRINLAKTDAPFCNAPIGLTALPAIVMIVLMAASATIPSKTHESVILAEDDSARASLTVADAGLPGHP